MNREAAKASDDLVGRLREESLQLARRSFDSADAGISANLCDSAIDEIERLEERCLAYKGQVKAGSDEIERLSAQLAAAEANAEHGWTVAGNEHSGRIAAEASLETAKKALDQEAANLRGALRYMEETIARRFEPSHVVTLVSLVAHRLEELHRSLQPPGDQQ